MKILTMCKRLKFTRKAGFREILLALANRIASLSPLNGRGNESF